ncbi:hypothetical protein EJ05DRAFT_344845 [Pseudovirgaria hyperparasitica]|uniref:Uncharacterized protein n=1 Tax=Pseudovirgaria hyperparasitica TaxID=470096 RepID=A0A6A6WBQ9_9PEZI|nr:uncharacterized protein EJ05DRAFT_344845 [Pseudovirgaria hyperparasitica]KAF2759400.1 hypothetical protein EJ05DRAFT_344845 [Pseudovirgaria hyperparasitica]
MQLSTVYTVLGLFALSSAAALPFESNGPYALAVVSPNFAEIDGAMLALNTTKKVESTDSWDHGQWREIGIFPNSTCYRFNVKKSTATAADNATYGLQNAYKGGHAGSATVTGDFGARATLVGPKGGWVLKEAPVEVELDMMPGAAGVEYKSTEFTLSAEPRVLGYYGLEKAQWMAFPVGQEGAWTIGLYDRSPDLVTVQIGQVVQLRVVELQRGV